MTYIQKGIIWHRRQPTGKYWDKQTISNYGTEDSNFSRDPIGQQGTKADIAAEGRTSSKSVYHGLKSSLQKIKKQKQVLKEEEENGLLSEKNIKSKE